MNDYRLRVFAPVCLLLCAAAAVIAAAPAPASFSVGGAVASPQAWTPAALTQRFAGQATTLAYTLKGARHTSRAVPLEAILEAAQPKTDPRVKHAVLQGTVIVTGQDGYTVVFSLGELAPDFGHEAVWIALDEDGKTAVQRCRSHRADRPGRRESGALGARNRVDYCLDVFLGL